jgi:nitrogen regulatory protein PII
MKKIEAFIKSYRLNDVTRALHCVEGLTGMTITDARGLGRGGVDQCEYKPSEKLGIFQSIIRIEVFCRDELADTVVSTIEKAAHTGLRGDGKIYVISVEEAVRISVGERGELAV